MAKKKKGKPKKKGKVAKIVKVSPNIAPKNDYANVIVEKRDIENLNPDKTLMDTKDKQKSEGKEGVIHPKRVRPLHPKTHKK